MPRGFYKRRSPDERFWSRVDKNGPTPSHRPELGECWLWTGSKNKDGSGRFWLEGKTRRASVVAYLLSSGELPSGTDQVLHSCDGGDIACVRPSHLFAGTAQSNRADCVSKQRHCFGERNGGGGRLTAQAVLEMRERYARGGVKQQDLATEYGVTQVMVSRVIRRESWTHVNGDIS